jgi:hypothetical protein
MVFGENRGDRAGDYARALSVEACGGAVWRRDKPRIYREMREPDASETAPARGWKST